MVAPFWLDSTASRRDRRDAGRARRRNLPHEALVEWPADALDPIAALGTAPTTGLQGQLVGMGADLVSVRDERSGRAVVDLDRLDDAIEGPWEWDVRAMSWRLALRATAKARARVVTTFSKAYRDGIRAAAALTRPGGWESIDEGPGAARARARLVRGRDEGRRARRAVPTTRRGAAATEWVAGAGRIAAECLPWEHETVSADRVMRHLAEYRESLSEAAAFRLQRYSVVDAVCLPHDDSLLVLLFGADHDDRLLLRGRPVGQSVWEPYAGDIALGSDAQRILMASGLVQVSPDPLLGWSSDPTSLRSIVWSQAVDPGPGEAATPAWLLRREAEALGGALARAHAVTFDAPALAGYLGGSTGFDLELASSLAWL